MASGDTLLVFTPQANEPPAANYATLDVRNGRLVLDFDDTVAEAAIFPAIMPRNYAGGGLTVSLHWAATSAVTGTGGWTVEFERIGTAQDLDFDDFAAVQTVAAIAVPATAGVPVASTVAVADGVNMDSIVVGEWFRLRIARDVTADTAVGDLELGAIEIRET